MKNKILVTLILMIALCTDINAQTKKPVRSAKPKPGKTEKTHPSVLPKDPDHGKGTPVGSLPVKKPVDAKKPRELEKSATVPAQDEQGGRQPGITTKDKQNGQPIPVDRAADRRAEDNKTLNQQSQAISPTQPQTTAPTPISAAPVNYAGDRRPESGKDLPPRPGMVNVQAKDTASDKGKTNKKAIPQKKINN